MRALGLLPAVLLACGLGACTVGPDYTPPSVPVPDSFTAAATKAAWRSDEGSPANVRRWWRAFGDAELTSLVERAIEANPDVEIALTRLQEARTQEVVVSGGSLPSVEFSAGAARGSGNNSVRGRVADPLHAGTNTTGLTEITQVLGLDASWEIDLFGKFRREIEAAKGDAQAAAEARSMALVTVAADVALNYLELRGVQARLAVANENVERQQHAVDVIQQRYDRGLINELDLTLAKRELETLRSDAAPLVAEINAASGRIAVLLGKYPEDMREELQHVGPLPTLPGRVKPGLPVDLLRQRPDIRQAERQLAAATARIGVATANLFPRLAVTGGIGMQGQGLGRSPATNAFIWSVGPELYWPLLDFGTLDAQIDLQDYRTREALIGYRKTIETAVREVDEAIGNYDADQDRLQHLRAALVESRRAATLAEQRYDRGLVDFLNVLDAQRQEYALEDQYTSAEETAALHLVALYKAMGGGWEPYQAVPPIRKPQPAIFAMFSRLGTDAGTAQTIPVSAPAGP